MIQVSRMLSQLILEQEQVGIFYCTESTDVQFVDEPGVSQLGELSIDIGKPFQTVEDKTVEVTLMFGQTNIRATATNKDSTEVKNCEFKFESN